MNLREAISGQPTMKSEKKRIIANEDFQRGVVTANLYAAQQKLAERAQQLTLREALFQQQANQFAMMQQQVEAKAGMVGSILGQVMGGGGPQGGMPPGPQQGGMPPDPSMMQGGGQMPPPEDEQAEGMV